LTLMSDRVAAESSFGNAISLAQRLGAKLFELRAALDLVRLWRDQGKVQQARELLAPIYGWFTEGFDTRDLKEAKALLDVLEREVEELGYGELRNRAELSQVRAGPMVRS
jgi:predicted ATPase